MLETTRRIEPRFARITPSLGAGVLVLLLASSAQGADLAQRGWVPRIGAELPVLNQPSAEEVVAAMYAKAQDLLRGSGHEITIGINAVRSLDRQAFETARWRDLVTLGDRSIQLTPNYMSSDVIESTVHIAAEWVTKDGEQIDREALADISLREAAAIVDRPGFHKKLGLDGGGVSIALTTYTVRLDALGERQVYQAAVFWRRLEDGTYSASIQDHVLPIDLIVWIDDQPTPHASLTSLTAQMAERMPFASPLAKMQICEIDSLDTAGSVQTVPGSLGHNTGTHSASIQLGAFWTCSANCVASCTPEIITATCTEDASSTYTDDEVTSHKITRAIRQKGQSQNPSLATCAMGQQCAFAECVGGVCPGVSVGVGISIVGSGANVSFANASGALDAINLDDSITLPCRLENPFCSTNQTVIHALSIDGPVALPPAKSGYTLDRIEASDVVHHGQPVRYLMEEWALIDHDAEDGAGAVIQASSTRYGHLRAAGVQTTGFGNKMGAPGTMLVIEAPAHEDNDRLIPLPALRFAADPLPAGTPEGRAIVRIDVADDRSIQDLTVIQDTVGGLPTALLEAIGDRLAMDFASDKQHRVVTFAVLEIGKTVSALDSVVLLPKCCGCVPVPGHFCE